MRARTSLLLALMLSSASALAAPKADPQAAAAIAAVNQAIGEAFGRGDAAAIAARYTEDAQLLPPDADFVSGRAAVQEFWKKMILSGIPELHLESVEVKSAGATAYEVGRYRLGGKSGRPVGQGKYIVIWKRDGRTWRLHRDIWNATPAP